MKIIKIPFEEGALGKNRGCAEAPDKIIEALSSDTINEDSRAFRKEIAEVKIEKSNFQKTHESIFNEIKKTDSAIIIGGDHSITYPAFKASGCEGLVIFDAHPDMMGGTEMPSHEDFARKLIEEGSVLPENIILFGIRSWHSSEMDFIKEKDIKFFTAKYIFEFGIKEIADTLMELAVKFKKLYLSVDIDVADPAFAPGTGYAETGGFSSRELIYLMQRMKHLKNLKFIDVVEVNSRKDLNNLTVNLATKIIKEIE